MPLDGRRTHGGPGGGACSVDDALAEASLGSRRRGYTSKGARMAPPNKPVTGNLYSPKEQYEMHGGNQQQCAPIKEGRVLLLRLKPDHNSDAPYIADWEASNDRKVDQIREQTQQEPLPVYVRRRANEWEYMGRFRVTHVATDGPTLARRKERSGHKVSYAIRLERS